MTRWEGVVVKGRMPGSRDGAQDRLAVYPESFEISRPGKRFFKKISRFAEIAT